MHCIWITMETNCDARVTSRLTEQCQEHSWLNARASLKQSSSQETAVPIYKWLYLTLEKTDVKYAVLSSLKTSYFFSILSDVMFSPAPDFISSDNLAT